MEFNLSTGLPVLLSASCLGDQKRYLSRSLGWILVHPRVSPFLTLWWCRSRHQSPNPFFWGGVHKLATALKVVEEVQEVKGEWEDDEVEGLKVEEIRSLHVWTWHARTRQTWSMRCNVWINDDKNLTDKHENCALTCQCSCALCWGCSGSWWSRCYWCSARFHLADVIPSTDFFPSVFCSSLLYL